MPVENKERKYIKKSLEINPKDFIAKLILNYAELKKSKA